MISRTGRLLALAEASSLTSLARHWKTKGQVLGYALVTRGDKDILVSTSVFDT